MRPIRRQSSLRRNPPPGDRQDQDREETARFREFIVIDLDLFRTKEVDTGVEFNPLQGIVLLLFECLEGGGSDNRRGVREIPVCLASASFEIPAEVDILVA